MHPIKLLYTILFHRLHRKIIVVAFWILCFGLYGQPKKSAIGAHLSTKLEALDSDTARVTYLLQVTEEQHMKSQQKALEFAVKALVLARKSGSKTHLMDALNATSKCYFYAGQTGEAATYIEEYADVAQLYGSDLNKAFAHNDLAVLKMIIPHESPNQEIIELFNKSLIFFGKIAPKGPDRVTDSAYQQNIAAIYGNIGNEYKNGGSLTQAESYFIKALTLLEKTSINTPLGVRTIAGYADLLRLQNKKHEFFQQYERGMSIVQKMDYGAMYPLFFYLMAQWYESREDKAMAIQFYKKTCDLSVAHNNHSYTRLCATKLSTLYEQTNNLKNALKFSRLAEECKEKEKMSEIALNLKQADLKKQFRIWEQEILQQNKKRMVSSRWLAGLILALFALSLTMWLRTRKKHRRTVLKQMETELNEQKLILEKKMLEAELEASNKALTTEIMRKIQRNDLIRNTVAQLQQYSKDVSSDKGNILRSAVKSLGDSLEKDTWKEFEIRFKQVDQRFYEKLSEIGPNLTQGEIRICALLHLNMNSKEISAITSQSVRAIEQTRSKIRKKLEISNSEISLTQFLNQL